MFFVLKKWQATVNLLASAMGSYCGRISRLLPDRFETLVTSEHEKNTDRVGLKFPLENYKWYCKAVCDSNRCLIVNNSEIEDPKLFGGPSSDQAMYGVKSYIGFPIKLPDGKIFGTMCIENETQYQFTEEHIQALKEYAAIIETDIEYQYLNFKAFLAEKSKNNCYAKIIKDLIDSLSKLTAQIKANEVKDDWQQDFLNHQQSYIKQLEESIEKCADINSHQLRGPVARILGLVRLIDSDEKLFKEALAHLKTAVNDLDEITKQIQNVLYHEK